MKIYWQSKFIEPKQVFLGIAETINSFIFIFIFILGKVFCYLSIYLFIYLFIYYVVSSAKICGKKLRPADNKNPI